MTEKNKWFMGAGQAEAVETRGWGAEGRTENWKKNKIGY